MYLNIYIYIYIYIYEYPYMYNVPVLKNKSDWNLRKSKLKFQNFGFEVFKKKTGLQTDNAKKNWIWNFPEISCMHACMQILGGSAPPRCDTSHMSPESVVGWRLRVTDGSSSESTVVSHIVTWVYRSQSHVTWVYRSQSHVTWVYRIIAF